MTVAMKERNPAAKEAAIGRRSHCQDQTETAEGEKGWSLRISQQCIMASSQFGHRQKVHGPCQGQMSDLGGIVRRQFQAPYTITQSEVCQRGVEFDSENFVEAGVPSVVVPLRMIEIVPHGCTRHMEASKAQATVWDLGLNIRMCLPVYSGLGCVPDQRLVEAASRTGLNEQLRGAEAVGTQRQGELDLVSKLNKRRQKLGEPQAPAAGEDEVC